MENIKHDAVVLAGGKIKAKFAQKTRTKFKCFIRLNNQYLINRVINALKGSSSINRIVIVGPKEKLIAHGIAQQVDEVVKSEESGFGNIIRGLNALESPGRVLLAGSDLPFVTAQAIDDFISRCPSQIDIAYPVIKRSALETRFPKIKKQYIKLRQGHFTGGGAIMVNHEVVFANRRRLEAVFAGRKNLLALAAKLGLKFIFKFIFGRLGLEEIEARANSLLSCNCQAIRGVLPELVIDVDTEYDFQLAKRQIANLPK